MGWGLPDSNQAQAESDAQGENHGPMARFPNEQIAGSGAARWHGAKAEARYRTASSVCRGVDEVT